MSWLWNFVRTVFMVLLVAVLTLAFFYLLSLNRGREASGLAQTLERVGERAMLAVRDPQERERIAALYEQFVEQVRRRQISPRWVEKVAARALNLAYGKGHDPNGAEDLRRALVVAQNAPRPSKASSGSEETWTRVEKKVRAAEGVMLYWERRTAASADSTGEVPVLLDDNLRPRVDSVVVRRLRELEEKQRQLRALHEERLQQLRERQRLLDSLRRMIEAMDAAEVSPDTISSLNSAQ